MTQSVAQGEGSRRCLGIVPTRLPIVEAPPPLPLVLGVGAQKPGATALFCVPRDLFLQVDSRVPVPGLQPSHPLQGFPQHPLRADPDRTGVYGAQSQCCGGFGGSSAKG